MPRNIGDWIILFMVSAGFAGMFGMAVFKWEEWREDNEERTRARHLAQFEAEKKAAAGTPPPDVSDRGEL